MPPITGHQWRSLDEFAATPEFRDWVQREFPPFASEWNDEVSRRNFLKLMGASLALAGVTGCTRQPLEKIVPYVKQPEDLVPGNPLFFATALTLGGHARGVLVESHEGHPTKIEGNPQHPASLGATDIFMQAEILNLYDPDRSQELLKKNEVATWNEFLTLIAAERVKWKMNRGAGLRLLTGNITSPTLLGQIAALFEQFPLAKWHVYEPLAPAEPQPFYNLAQADVIVSIDNDFLGPGPVQLKYARDFAGRRTAADNVPMNRLYVAESTPTLTGARADHRVALAPAALRELGADLATGNGRSKWAAAMIEDLRQHTGKSLILIGDSLPTDLRRFARSWNQPLQIAEPSALPARSLRELVEDMGGEKVQALMILGGNPAYDAPVNFDFQKKLSTVPLRVRLSLYEDETSALCDWHIPENHCLESWSDARAFDDSATIMQPLIEPLYGGKSAHELVSILAGDELASGYEIVRRFWRNQTAEENFEKFWRRSLHDGIVAASAIPPKQASAISIPEIAPGQTGTKTGDLELLLRRDPHIYDGRFANNAWLQELPKPFTKLTWDNAALISVPTAQRLELANEQIVELKFRGRSMRVPVCILPGQADDCVTLHLGYGRTNAGRVGNGAGENAYALLTADEPWGGPGLDIVKTGSWSALAITQKHQSMEGRELVRTGTFAEFQQMPGAIAQAAEPPPTAADSLYPGFKYKNHAWGMAIDLGACIGCNACTMACQAENNIPVVGKEQVIRGREMHWIRVDNYFQGTPENPRLHFQPVPCMHCENAPCELVCPVGATVHSSEGLNQMVYNRCVGTRYCSNNCPYKVRRFNFLEFGASQYERASILKMQRNPDVTVRTRGVMEKCTYCVQRINRVRIDAELHNREIRDGEIVPACAQACPAAAIIFGDINDPQSRVSKFKASPLNYSLLAELNARPRTTYLAKLNNPNPVLEKS